MANRLRHRLMNLKYYYPHGMFDLLRRREKNLLLPSTEDSLCQVAADDIRRFDSLILISAVYPLQTETEPPLVPFDGQNPISPLAADALRALLGECERACGEKILLTSTYRTFDFQRSIYGVNPFAAKPGESEHHSGLAADLKVDGFAGRRFLLSKTGKWMAQNAHRFGFIVRYPLWGEKKTGVDYEPWHLRFVGAPHAEILYRSKITLEEYLENLQIGAFYRFGDTVLSRQSQAPFAMPPQVREVFASAYPCGGYVLWGKKT